MAKIYKCRMTKTVAANIEAETMQQAMDWISTHDEADILAQTKRCDTEYSDEVVGETDEDADISLLQPGK